MIKIISIRENPEYKDTAVDTREPLSFIIRQETVKDHAEVYSLIKTAFETANVKDGDEQDFAVKLRNSKGFVPELSLVAELDGKLIGHIMMTKTHVEQADGSMFEALLVAPLSVLLEHRNKGIGSSLMEEAIRIATSLGYKAAFLVGDPNYYNRFGYRQTSFFGIKPRSPIPDQFVQVLELQIDSLKGIQGTVDCL